MKAHKELKSLVEGLTARKWERWLGSQGRRPPTLWLFLYITLLYLFQLPFLFVGTASVSETVELRRGEPRRPCP